MLGVIPSNEQGKNLGTDERTTINNTSSNDDVKILSADYTMSEHIADDNDRKWESYTSMNGRKGDDKTNDYKIWLILTFAALVIFIMFLIGGGNKTSPADYCDRDSVEAIDYWDTIAGATEMVEEVEDSVIADTVVAE